MRVGITGLSKNSPSIRMAGLRGCYLPVSVYSGVGALDNHWQNYQQACQETGREAKRSDHRVVRDVLVADTDADADARKLAIEGGMGKAWREYMLPIYKHHNLLDSMISDPDMSSDDVDIDWLCDNVWIIGSPDTVLEKLRAWRAENGEFGTLMIYNHDYSDDPAPWNESVHRLAQDIAPRLR
ncbi:hypothetical protein ABZ863_13850 [Saccharomonospora sp. NPDC046836]|uniref:hypothetical protein n=1 Tax=Saccharomonospora sp. NPDC046836 TaxID=3156921 RepID=UPI0033CD8E2F